MTKKMSGFACANADSLFTRGRAQEATELSAKGAAKKGFKRPAVHVERPAPVDQERSPLKGKTAGIPFRQAREPKPIAQLSADTLDGVALLVQSRVARVARARSCCCYVFVRDGQVYVLSEELASANAWAVQHTAEWAGCYGGMPDLAVLADDLRMMLPIR